MCNNRYVKIISEDPTGCENYLRTSSQRRVWPSGWSWLVLGPLQPARMESNGKTAVFKENPPCCWPRHRWLAVQFPGALFIKSVTLTILLHKNIFLFFLLQNCSCWYCKWPRNKPVTSSVGVYYKDVPLLLVPLSNNGARRCPRKWQFSCMTREPWISWIENQGRWLCIIFLLLFCSVCCTSKAFFRSGAVMIPSLSLSMMPNASLNSWICFCENREKMFEPDFLAFFDPLGGWNRIW